MAVLVAAVTLILGAASTVQADTLTIMWDSSPSSGVAGYRVYIGTQSGVYAQNFNAGNSNAFVFQDAAPGVRYYVAVSAYAQGGLEGPKSQEISGFSNAPPSLSSVSNRSSVQGQSTSLQLEASDPYGEALTFSADNLPAGLTLTASTGRIAGTPTTPGAYSVTVRATDGVLTAQRQFTWTITAAPAPPQNPEPPAGSDPDPPQTPQADTTLPNLAITAPSGAASFTSTVTPLPLAGTASDNVGVTQVRWQRGGASGTANGTTSWTASVPLQVGPNSITVTARDAAGNVRTHTVQVTYLDSHAPVVSITVPTAAPQYTTYGANVALSGTAADNIGIASITWTASNGASGSAPIGATWTIGPVDLPLGETQFVVTAQDMAGNRGSAMLTVQRLLQAAFLDVVTITPDGEGIVTSVPAGIGGRSITGTSVRTLPGFESLQSGGAGGLGLMPRTASQTAASQAPAPPPSEVESARGSSSSNGGTRIAVPRSSASQAATTPAVQGATTAPPPAQAASRALASPLAAQESAPLNAAAASAAPGGDEVAPKVTITSPSHEEGAAVHTTSDDTVFVVGVAVDNRAVTQVVWRSDRDGQHGAADGTSVWHAEIPLVEGINVIDIVARDAAGNESYAVLRVRKTAAGDR